MMAVCWLKPKPQRYEAFAATCALLVSIGLSEFTTQILKAYVGRLRPNFYAMCQFDTTTLTCLAPYHDQKEARQSFPSGHSSLSMQGMMCLTLFMLGRIMSNYNSNSNNSNSNNSVNGKQTTLAKVCALAAVVIPIWISFGVGASRLVDNWHHPSDVAVGWAIGGWSAFVGYHCYFAFPLGYSDANY